MYGAYPFGEPTYGQAPAVTAIPLQPLVHLVDAGYERFCAIDAGAEGPTYVDAGYERAATVDGGS